MIHVPVIKREYIELILAGKKTAELRLTRHRIVPHGRVARDERLYFKQSSGLVRATAIVTHVETFESLTPRAIRQLARDTSLTVRGKRTFFEQRATARYATVVHFHQLEPCRFGPDFSAERAANPRAAWLILPPEADVYPACIDRGLLTG